MLQTDQYTTPAIGTAIFTCWSDGDKHCRPLRLDWQITVDEPGQIDCKDHKRKHPAQALKGDSADEDGNRGGLWLRVQ